MPKTTAEQMLDLYHEELAKIATPEQRAEATERAVDRALINVTATLYAQAKRCYGTAT